MLTAAEPRALDQIPAEAVEIALSYAHDAAEALAEIGAQVAQTDPSFVLLFIPNTLDRAALLSR